MHRDRSDTHTLWLLPSLIIGLAAGGCGRSADATRLASGAPGAHTDPAAVDPDRARPSAPSSAPPSAGPPSAAQAPGDGAPGAGQALLFDVLERECRVCHDGAAGSPGGALFSLEYLLESGLLKPGLAQLSTLMLWLQYGDSRAEHAAIAVTRQEFDALSAFINELDPYLPDPCGPGDPLSRDRLLAALRADLEARPAADRPFVRYVTLTHAINAGVCGLPLARLLSAVRLLPNATSREAAVVAPELLDEVAAVVLDLRDYAYDRPLDVDADGASDFADAWLAIVDAAGGFALELGGADADALKRETGTRVPVLAGNAFVFAAGDGPLYHQLIGVGADAWQMASALGVRRDASPARAGVLGGARQAPRVVSRHEQAAFPGHAYWTREEVAPGADGSWIGSLEAAPIGFTPDSHEAIFHLPNGMLGFVIAAADGTPVGSIPRCVIAGACATDMRATGTMTCRGCHAGRLYRVDDEVAALAGAEPELYESATLSRIRAEYGQLAGSEVWDADVALHLDAVSAAAGTFPAQAIESEYYHFLNAPITLRVAAAELGVSEAQLVPALERLRASGEQRHAQLDALLAPGGSLDRLAFGDSFVALACAIEGPLNRPARCP